MNPTFKRSLAIAALAPLAFIGSVGPASAGGVDAYDPNPVISPNTPSDDDITVRCDHPQDPTLEGLGFDVIINTEGDGTDFSDIDSVTILAVDRDWSPDGDTDESEYHESFKQAWRAKLELFKAADLVLDDHPKRVYKDTEKIRRSSPGQFDFRVQEDGIGFIRATVTWYNPIPGGDDDAETLSCVAYDPQLPAAPQGP